jgi:hypothetical protein
MAETREKVLDAYFFSPGLSPSVTIPGLGNEGEIIE